MSKTTTHRQWAIHKAFSRFLVPQYIKKICIFRRYENVIQYSHKQGGTQKATTKNHKNFSATKNRDIMYPQTKTVYTKKAMS